MSISKIIVRTMSIAAIAALCLVATVSCSKKKEEEKQASLPDFTPKTATETIPEPEEETDEVMDVALDEEDPAPSATVEVVKTPPPAPRRQHGAAQPRPAHVPAPTPTPAPVPAAPVAASGTVVVENIYGPRQVGIGRGFTLTCKTAGEGKITEYVWRLRNGDDVYEKHTSEPKLETALSKTGEWRATCEAWGETGRFASRTIRFEVAESLSVAKQGISIEYIAGPKSASPGQVISLRCNVRGTIKPTMEFVWRFRSGNDVVEKRSREQNVTVTFEKAGEYAATCDIVEGSRTLASQRFSIRIAASSVSINAGGPYSAMMNKPARVRGNALTSSGRIVKYEWFIDGVAQPIWSETENGVAQHTFTKSGAYKGIFKVTLSDGTSASDTAVINVGSMKPIANAGGDIASSPGRKVKLNGSGKSPDGQIVKYEWDFDGDGTYDWSSDKNGVVTYAFKAFSRPVFRVTDTEGNTAEDTIRVVICPSDMVPVPNGKYCIDRYEWPNKLGATAQTNVNWYEAVKSCESIGKRLCTSDEWQRACRNDRTIERAGAGAFPYGNTFSEEKCNTLGNQRVQNKLAASGLFGECVGSVGAFDMSGNAAEWTWGGNARNAAVFGGFYQSGADAANCDSRMTLEKDKTYLFTGFRCCK